MATDDTFGFPPLPPGFSWDEPDLGAPAVSQVPFVSDAIPQPAPPAAPVASAGLPAMGGSRSTRFSPEVDGILDNVSQTYGVDRNLLGAFAAIESGGNPRTRTGSYKGLFQLSDKEFARNGGAGDIYNPIENAKAAAVKLKAESQDFARRYGREPSAAELYMIHQQGVGGADKHWRNPDAPAWQNMYATAEGQQKGPNWAKKAIWGNVPTDMRRKFGDVNNITSRDFVDMWNTKVERFGGGRTSAYPLPKGEEPAPVPSMPLDSPLLVAKAPAADAVPPLPPGFTWDDQQSAAAPSASEPIPALPPGFTWDDTAPAAQPEGFFSGLWKAFSTGAKQTGSSLKAAAGTYAGSADTVVESAKYSQAIKKDDPAALAKFSKQVEDKKAEYGDTVWGGIKNVASAAVDNPRGVLEFVVQQSPNTLAAMTPALTGAAIGSFAGPLGSAAGFLVGLFGGNTILETGGKAQEKANDGSFTDAERSETIKEGTTKGGVITAIDAATLGTSKWWFGATSRAVEKATAKALTDRGIDAAAAASTIKMAQAQALAASKGLPKDQVVKSVTDATVDAMRRTGLSDDAIVMAVKEAQDNAVKLSNSVAKRAGRFGGAVALETVGEGVGEYLGELAATGQSKPTDAVLEAIAGLTMSVTEAGSAKKMGVESPGALTRGFSATAPSPASTPEAGTATPVAAQPAPAPAASQPVATSVSPNVSPEDRAILLKANHSEEDLADASPEEIAADVARAREAGVTVTPEEIQAATPKAPDQPSAEPVADLTAQIDAMSRGERGGVYLSADNLANAQSNPEFVNRIADALNKASGAELIQNVDGKGGMLVTANKPVADLVRVALGNGIDTQALLGLVTGAGVGKPADGNAVVQQKTPDGAVTKESLVRAEDAPQVAAQMEKPGATVETVTPDAAVQRREDLIAAEQSGMTPPAVAPNGDGTRKAPVKVSTADDISIAEQQVAEPTEAQKESGNYKKGHVNIQGLDITIENPNGSIRSGTSPDGNSWQVTMPAAYGYVKRTVGRDNDQVDVFLGPDPGAQTVYVIDQVDSSTGAFDEHKAMVGFPSRSEALSTYHAAFSDGRAGDRIGGVAEIDIDTFKDWLAKGKRSRPITKLEWAQRRAEAAAADANQVDTSSGPVAARPERQRRERYDGPPLSADDVETIVSSWEYVREFDQKPKPVSLARFITSGGGIEDRGGDVKNMAGGVRGGPGLIRRAPEFSGLFPRTEGTGSSPDEWAMRAWEAGYFPSFQERPSINDLYDALEEDLSTGEVVPVEDMTYFEDKAAADEIARELDESYNIGISQFRTADGVRSYFGHAPKRVAREAEGDQQEARPSVQPQAEAVENLEPPFDAPVVKDDLTTPTVKQDETVALDEAPETGPSDSGPAEQPLSAEDIETLVKAWRYVKAIDDQVQAGKNVPDAKLDKANELDADLFDYGISIEDFQDEQSVREHLSGGGEQVAERPVVTEEAKPAKEAVSKPETTVTTEAERPQVKPGEPEWDFIPNAGWRDHQIRARVYAAALRIPFKGLDTAEIVAAIDKKMAEYVGAPEGVSLMLSDTTLDVEDARIKGGEFKAVAQRKSPWSSVDGYGANPLEAATNAVRRLLPKQTSLVLEATTSEKIKAEEKAKSEKGKASSEDAGPLFNPDAGKQTDLVDLAKKPVEEKPADPDATDIGRISSLSRDQLIEVVKGIGRTPKKPETLVGMRQLLTQSVLEAARDGAKSARITEIDGKDVSPEVVQKASDEAKARQIVKINEAIDKVLAKLETTETVAEEADGKADSGKLLLIGSGDILTSKSGRELSPVPKVSAKSVKSTNASIREINAWLKREALAEIEVEPAGPRDILGDDAGKKYRKGLVNAIDAARATQSDQDTLNEIVFGDAMGPTQSNLVRRGDSPDALVVVLRGAGFKTIVEARKFVKEAGILPADATNKQIDETIETAVVAAARQIVAEDKRPSETFAALTALYANQPNLASRTGTSVANQAYSTPAPLAYVASRLAGVSAADSVYEPSAGNGMLLIEADTEATTANEIDPARAQALKAQGFAVTEKDGAEVPSLKNIESVIMNPPFGAVKNGGASKVFKIGDLATTKIDHAISLNALEAMADDGKAVLIIGGVKAEDPKERAKGYRGLNMRDAASGRGRDNFYRVLYDKYNVVDHFTVSGDLYTKQGASWPVDVIVIDGRGQSQRPLPGTNQGVPDLLKTWGQVGEKITDDAANDRARNRPARPTVEPNGRPASVDAVRSEQDGGTRAEQPTPEEGGQPAASGQGTVRGESSSSGNNAERPRDVRPEADRDGGRVDRNRAPRKRERVKVSEGATQATYQPISETQSVDTLVPANMADAVRNALERVDMEQGGVDQRVSSALGYETDDDGMFFLSKDPTTGEVEKKRPFSAEQIDAIALAISNIEKGDALIVGDATGIGKGRIGAAILRYAMKRGLVPVLVTEKMDLYGDMYRDMRDIGMFEMLGREPHILTTDTSKTIPLDEEAVEWKADAEAAQEAGEPAPKRRGKFLSGGTPAAKEKAYDGLLRGDDVADVIFTTYSQMQTLGENAAEPRRRKVLRSIASRSVMIFDEAHNAAGTGIVDDARGKKAADGGRAQFVRNLAQGANGVVFMSATYAKRPNVMDLYARTDMGKAVSDIKDLPALIQKGGVPMQQIVASMLAESGQYLRRERSFDGIEYAVEEAPVDEAAYDKFVGAVQAIFQFDLSVKESRKDIIEEILDSLGAGRAGMDSGIGEASATSTSFSSIMHNIVSQMLLAIKANAAAERAIAAVKAGEKPVITLANTNESFISDFAASDGTAIGQPLDIDFGAMLKRYLQRTLRITYKEAGAKKPSHYQIPLERLPIHMQNAYRDVERLIDDGDYDGMPVSPIDWIRYRMADAGISVREITGRKTMLDYSKKTPTLVARPKGEAGSAGKRVTISKFNGGSLDAVILNQSGSTGVSMHTNRTFKDQRKRRMILAQAEANIDTHMQMLGRVNRTGQVVLPAYSQLAANIPAEVRPTAVLMKKMASLNANTTGARGSAFTADAVDFMNEVGDKIMAEYLSENYDVNEALGEPYSGENTENLVRDATGKLVLLSVAEQRRMLDEIQAKYKAALDELDALGENPLEAKKLDLQARTIESSELRPRQGDSPFLDAVRIEKVSVKAQGRAMPPSEVVGKISDFIKIEKPSSDVAPALGAMADRGSAWMRDEVQRVGTLIREQIREEVASVKAESKESTRRRLLDQFQRWQTTMALMHPGARVAVNMPSGQVSGIVTSVERTGKAKNMGALGSWTVKIAVADSLRELTFPMSKLFPPGTARGDTEAGAEVSRSNLGPVDMVAAFEDARKEGRETRFMVTGNILGGFDETRGNGQIVTYTTDAGEVKPGILMKRGFEMGKFMEKRRIRFQTGAQVATFLDRVSDVEVAGRDGDVLLGRDRYGYYIRMSSARAKAGRYFTDRTVRDAIAPQDFERRSGQMRVEELAWDQFVSAVDAMKAIGAGFETDTAQDEAQAIVSGEALSSVAGASGTHDPAIIRRIERNLKAGRATNIDRGAVKLALDAIEPDLDLMPPGGLAGTVSRIEPGSAPGHVRVSVTLSNGKVVTAMIAWDTIKASRSLFLPGRRPAIVSLHFTPVHGSGRDGVGQQAGSRLVGEVSEEAISIADALRADFRHELVHALRFVGALDGRRWGRLVSHASSLGLLGLDITLPASQRIMARELGVEPNRTLRESYTERYARHDNMQELLDQESVASLMELVWLGSLSDADVAPVRDILDDLAKGDLRGSGRQVDAGGPLSSLQQADVATGQSMRRDIDTLGYYSKALESARGLKQAKGTPEQMLAQLKASGVKDAEIDATKLRDVFDSKKSVTRDEIVAHLEMNRVALAEVRRGKIEGPELDRLFGRVDEYLAQLDPRMTQAQRADMVDRLRWNNATDRSPDAALNSIIAMMPANVRADMEALQHETIDTKWSTYSLDPSNPTYRETVIHLPDNSGLSSAQVMGNALAELGNLQALLAGQRPTNSRVEDTAFRSGHFPEPNIIGHMMTSMVKHEGNPVFLVDQIQSDWGQKLRDGGVRDEAKIADLKARFDEADRLNKEAHATLKAAAKLDDGAAFDAANEAHKAALANKQRLEAELRTAEAATPGNPLVNTTDQWVNTTLRRAIRQAAEANAEYIAIPTGNTVLSYNPGDEEGMAGFYGDFLDPKEIGIVPKNLRNLLRKIDPDTPSPQRIKTLDSPSGKTGLGEGFTLFALTDAVKRSVMKEGQPMFSAVPTPADGLTPDAGAKKADLSRDMAEAINLVNRMAGRDAVRVVFSDRISADGMRADQAAALDGVSSEIAGKYTPPTMDAKALIEFSLSVAGRDLVSTAAHESYHHIETVHASPQELKLLRSSSEMARAKRLAMSVPGVTEELVNKMPDWEVRAIAFQRFAYLQGDGMDAGPLHIGVRRFWMRLVTIARNVRNALRGHGFNSMEAIFERARTGEMASRPAMAAIDARASANRARGLRGLVDPQMVPTNYVEREPFDLTNAREVRRYQARVPLDAISTTQPSVSVAATKAKVSSPGSDGKTSVFKWGDRYYVNDGNHRIEAARARGYKDINAEVIELAPKSGSSVLDGRGPADAAAQPVGAQADRAPSTAALDAIRRIAGQAANDGAVTPREMAAMADVKDFVNQWLAADDGASLTATSAYEGYVTWAEEAGVDILSFQTFMANMSDIDITTQHVAGRTRYVGLSMRKAGERPVAARTGRQTLAEQNASDVSAEVGKGVSIWQAIANVFDRLVLTTGIANTDAADTDARLAHLTAMAQRFANDNDATTAVHGNVVSLPGSMASVFPSATSSGTWLGRKVAATMRRMAPLSDQWRIRLQDKVLPIRRIQEAIEDRTGMKLPLNLDVYMAEANYHGRAGEQAADLEQDHVEPLVEHLRRNDIDGDAFGLYLYARHASERNTHIRTIDPTNDAGSGMTDKEANAILAQIQNGSKADAYREAGRMIDEVLRQTRERLLSSGLISRETNDAWSSQYKSYVPLRGFEVEGDTETVFPRTGRGFDVRGPEAKAALGRRSKSDNPMAYVLLQAHESIVRSEKNRVNKVLKALVEAHPDPDVWEMHRGKWERRINNETGLVERYFVPPAFSAHDPEIVGVKVGGRQHYIRLVNPNLARAVRGIGSSEFDRAIVRNIMKVTRAYAQLLTSWNPEFVVSNFFRDVQTALLNSKDVQDLPDGARKKMLGDALSLKSIRGIYNALRGDGTSEHAQYFEEFRAAGGKISFMEFNDVERIKHRIQGRINEKDWKRRVRAAAKYVEDVNTSVENGVRLSTYIAMRKAGVPKARAAFVARELTVNFNRKGEWGTIINAAYLFFNASVQGSFRMLQAVGKSPAVRRAVYSIVAGGIALDVLNYIIAGDDDDGENAYEKIKPWIKERNLIFMMPGRKDYAMIPLPYGYNLPFIAGQKLGEAARTAAGYGTLTPAKAAGGLLSSLLEVFNPLGTSPAFLSEGKGSFLQMVSPTILDPVVQVAENRTWYGGPVFPTKFDRNKPDSENYFASVHPAFITMAKWMNATTGGNAARSGFADVSPEVLEHYAQFVGGGIAKFALNATGTGHRFLSGEEFVPEKTPFVRRLYGAQTSTSRRRDFYEQWTAVDAAHYEVIQLGKAGDSDGAQSARAKYRAELEAYGAMKGASKSLSQFGKERTRIQLDKSLSDEQKSVRIKDIQDRENKLILRSMEVYTRAQKKYGASN